MKKSRKIVVLSLLLALVNANMSFANEVFKPKVECDTTSMQSINHMIESNKIDFTKRNDYNRDKIINDKKELYDLLMVNSFFHNKYITFTYKGQESYNELYDYVIDIVNNSNLCAWVSEVEIQEYKNKYSIRYGTRDINDDDNIQKADDFSETWLKENIKPEMDEEKVVEIIHDFLIRNSRYTKDTTGYCNNYNIYTAQGILLGHAGVCSGYADAFARMARMAGIHTKVICGETTGGHAWNIVKVNGKWKHLDVTADSTSHGIPTYYFFLKNADYMSYTHKWDENMTHIN